MAGRNHHHIPQLMQRGFAASTTPAGMAQVLVFRKGRAPNLAGTENTFVVRDFYGGPQDPQLDNALTDAEISLESFIQDIRVLSAGTFLGRSQSAADFVHLLSIRIRWIRDLAQRAFSTAVELVEQRTSSAEGRLALLVDQCKKDESFLMVELQKHAEKLAGRKLTRNERRATAKQGRELAARLIASPNSFLGHMNGPNPLPLEELSATARDATADGHRKALKRVIGRETSFRDYFLNLQWGVALTSERLISGDCGPIHFNDGGGLLGPMGVENRRESAGVVLPVSTHHVLYGTVDPSIERPPAPAINCAAASWSREAFIAAFSSAETDELHGLIGNRLDSWLEAQRAAIEARDDEERGA